MLSNPDADLDPVVLQDLKPNEKYHGPIKEVATDNEYYRSGKTNGKTDGNTASAFLTAVERLTQEVNLGDRDSK